MSRLAASRRWRTGEALTGLAFVALGLLGASTAPIQELVPLQRISTSALQPALGERVELELPYAGPWPPRLSWEGVDGSEGSRAWVTLDQLGPHRIEVLGLELDLLVVPGPVGTPSPPQALVTSLPQLEASCSDTRYPQLAGAWAVGCSGGGLVDTAVHLETRRVVELVDPVADPGVGGEGVVVAPDRVWVLPEARPERHRRPVEGIAPWATEGQRVAIATEGDLQWFALDEHARQHLSGAPAPWMPPAVGDALAWVDVGERDQLGEDIYVWVEGLRDAAPLVRREGDQRHAAADGEWVAWIEDDRVCVESLVTGLRSCTETDAHTSRSLSLWRDVACWEHWTGEDTDVRCSDGLWLKRPGHQRSPSRVGDWLLFQDRGRVLVAELSSGAATPAAPEPPG